MRYWTNSVKHYGNTTTNPVESQHSVMKYWVKTSRAALHTLFERADACVEVQLSKVREALQKSMVKSPASLLKLRNSPMIPLLNKVSLYCLKLMQMEFVKVVRLDTEPCSCVVRITHGFACACEMANAVHDCRGFTTVDLDQFWSTLTIGSHDSRVNENTEDNDCSQEFEEYAYEILESDPTRIRDVNRLIRR